MPAQVLIVSREVAKEAHEAVQFPVEIVKAVKLALADGWQPGTDVPAVILAVLAKAPQAIAGLDQLEGELAEKRGAVMQAVGIAVGDLAAALVG